MKISRPDLDKDVSFLMIRLPKRDVGDWEIEKDTKVCSLYPKRKKDFGVSNLNEIFTWVDASYGIHNVTRI